MPRAEGQEWNQGILKLVEASRPSVEEFILYKSCVSSTVTRLTRLKDGQNGIKMIITTTSLRILCAFSSPRHKTAVTTFDLHIFFSRARWFWRCLKRNLSVFRHSFPASTLPTLPGCVQEALDDNDHHPDCNHSEYDYDYDNCDDHDHHSYHCDLYCQGGLQGKNVVFLCFWCFGMNLWLQKRHSKMVMWGNY